MSIGGSIPQTYWDSKFDEYSPRERVEWFDMTTLPALLDLPRDARILDCGSGDGFLVARLRDMGFPNTYGITYQPMEQQQSCQTGCGSRQKHKR